MTGDGNAEVYVMQADGPIIQLTKAGARRLSRVVAGSPTDRLETFRQET
jgi:hypothetical protein